MVSRATATTNLNEKTSLPVAEDHYRDQVAHAVLTLLSPLLFLGSFDEKR